MRIRYECPKCGGGVTVLKPLKIAPECACRKGKNTTTMVVKCVPTNSEPGSVSAPPGSDDLPRRSS